VGLAELSVMEQRFHAVMECLGGTPKTEVANRYGVSRQTIHNWLAQTLVRRQKRRTAHTRADDIDS